MQNWRFCLGTQQQQQCKQAYTHLYDGALPVRLVFVCYLLSLYARNENSFYIGGWLCGSVWHVCCTKADTFVVIAINEKINAYPTFPIHHRFFVCFICGFCFSCSKHFSFSLSKVYPSSVYWLYFMHCFCLLFPHFVFFGFLFLCYIYSNQFSLMQHIMMWWVMHCSFFSPLSPPIVPINKVKCVLLFCFIYFVA